MEFEKIKKMILLVLFCLLLFLVFLVWLLVNTATAADSVVIIGGWGSGTLELEYLRKSIPGAIAIAPNFYWPLAKAARDVLRQLKEKGMALEELVLVGHSWGGLIAREIDAENPGMVQKIIVVATPNDGFWYVPRFVYEVDDSISQTSLYVIASIDDKTVPLKSVMTIARKITDSVVFVGLGHVDLLKYDAVAQKINFWVAK